MGDLQNRAERIRDERGVAQNTNTRVGQLLVDVIVGHQTDVAELLKNLKTRVDGAYVKDGLLYLTAGKVKVAGPLTVFPDAEKERIEVALTGKVDGAHIDGNKLYLTAGGEVIAGPLDVGSTGEIDRVTKLLNGKVDGAYVEDGALYLTAGDEVIAGPLEVGSGTGGGGGGVNMKVRAITPTVTSVADGSVVKVGYSFSSVYADDGSVTGDGVVTVTVNKKAVASVTAKQGDNEVDVTSYMTPGTNSIALAVSDSAGNTRRLSYSVNVVSIAIKSNFDSTQIFNGVIPFNFTPVGEGKKTVQVKLDGVVAYELETEASNRQLTCDLHTEEHGAHLIEAYITARVGTDEIRSNMLRYSVINVMAGNDTPIIACDWVAMGEVEQYSTVAIPFSVYHPGVSTAQVILKVNDEVVNMLEVERTRQVWNYKFKKTGRHTMTIACGEATLSFDVEVIEASVDIQPETSGLELYLTSQGRNNSEAMPGMWENNGVAATFSGFNFKNDGWLTDDKGASLLRVQAGGQVTIPLKLFGTDFKATGKTIEIEFATSNVADYEAVLIDCFSAFGLQVTAQQMRFSSESSHVETLFKEEERIRLSIVVEKRTENRLVYGYVNGVLSAVTQYSLNDNFVQPKPVNLVIGNEKATIDLYNIRVYGHNLTDVQILNNYMADMDDYDKRVTVYNRNRILNNDGEIDYNMVCNLLPCMTITGKLPTYKGDKQVNVISYEDRQNTAKSFTTTVKNDVQGTSSQYYPRKNYKWKATDSFILSETGQTLEGYALRDGAIPVDCFCMKADFAESSGTHNTGTAKLIEGLLRKMGQLAPPQETDERVRTTIDGFPCLIFHKETEESKPTFLGKYNFNNDKSTEDVFGFTPGCESWEVLNNVSDRVLFKVSDYEALDSEGKPDWQNDFEARYPDGNTDTTKLKRLTDWLVSVKDNPALFKEQAAEYLEVPAMQSYYLITELLAMVDQRAKNMFLTTYDGIHWRIIFYDNDTVCGINNEGAISFDYSVEYHDRMDSGAVFNGEQSTLWNNIEAAYKEELQAMYQEIRQKGYISYDVAMEYYGRQQSERWSETIYNQDGYFKYILPLLNKEGDYLYACQGSREEHRKWWLWNRFKYMDSKYNAGTFRENYATMRLYSPEGVVIPANGDFTLTPAMNTYVAVKWGSYVASKRCFKNTPVVFNAPEMVFNDTETIIYGADGLSSLGDLHDKYAGTVDVSKAVRLAELKVGSNTEGYVNDNLKTVAVGANKLLRRLTVENCTGLTQALDLSGCENVREVRAVGTNLKAIELSNGGVVDVLQYPAGVLNLILRNQVNLSDGLSVPDFSKVNTLWIDGCPGVDSYTLFKKCLNGVSPALTRVRLTKVDWVIDDASVLMKARNLKGIGADGVDVEQAVITGKCMINYASQSQLDKLAESFPELEVEYGMIKADIVTTFKFASSQSKAIKNGIFTCNQDFVKVNESTYTVIADEGEVLEIGFVCDNHDAYAATYTVTGTRTQNYMVTYIPLRTLRFQVYNTTTYPEGARVTIGKDVYKTDADGYVYLRTREALAGKVIASGYGSGEFSYVGSLVDTLSVIIVYIPVEVTVVVYSDYSTRRLLEGAVVVFGDETKTTDENGEARFNVVRGIYDVRIKKQGYVETSVNGISVGVTSMRLQKDIGLITLWEEVRPEKNGDIQWNVKCDDGYTDLEVTSENADYVIDWGDKTTTMATGTGLQTYHHVYPVNSSRLMRNMYIKNPDGITKAELKNGGVINAYWSIGGSKISGANFQGMYAIGDDLFKNDTERTVFLQALMNGKFETLPQGLLSQCINAESIASMLYSCRIKELPATLLDGLSNINNVVTMFQQCGSLKRIPRTFFDNKPNLKLFYNVYHYCSSLESAVVPDGVNRIEGDTFYMCRKLKEIAIKATIPPTMVNLRLTDLPADFAFYVPDESVEAYKTASGWSAFADHIKPMSELPAEEGEAV
ncbi:hypothetical protein [Bacteroides sp.]